MAKKEYIKVRLISEESPERGYEKVAKKPAKGLKAGEKLRRRMYNPKTRQHEWFKEKKLPSPKK